MFIFSCHAEFMTKAATRIPHVTITAAMALLEVNAFAEAILQTIRLSRAFLGAGRMICLDGLESQVAQLCARCLGLDRQAGTGLRLSLMAIQAELDATCVILASRQEVVTCPSMTS